jgi:hypothetical protein
MHLLVSHEHGTHYSAMDTHDYKCEEWWEKCEELNKMNHIHPRSQAAVIYNMYQHKNAQSNYPSILFQPWIPVWSHLPLWLGIITWRQGGMSIHSWPQHLHSISGHVKNYVMPNSYNVYFTQFYINCQLSFPINRCRTHVFAPKAAALFSQTVTAVLSSKPGNTK